VGDVGREMGEEGRKGDGGIESLSVKLLVLYMVMRYNLCSRFIYSKSSIDMKHGSFLCAWCLGLLLKFP